MPWVTSLFFYSEILYDLLDYVKKHVIWNISTFISAYAREKFCQQKVNGFSAMVEEIQRKTITCVDEFPKESRI